MNKIRLMILWFLILCSCSDQKPVVPLCRHQVLSQYAAYKDEGYQVKLWHMKNKNPKASGFKYHVALRVRKDNNDKWQWVAQTRQPYRLETQQPLDTELLREISFDEVVKWAKIDKGNTNER